MSKFPENLTIFEIKKKISQIFNLDLNAIVLKGRLTRQVREHFDRRHQGDRLLLQVSEVLRVGAVRVTRYPEVLVGLCLDLDLKDYLKEHGPIREEMERSLYDKIMEKKNIYNKKLERKKVFFNTRIWRKKRGRKSSRTCGKWRGSRRSNASWFLSKLFFYLSSFASCSLSFTSRSPEA